MSDRADIDVAAFRERLKSRRQEIKSLSDSSAESRRPVELDQTRTGRLSRMDALQGQAMAQATQRRREQELQRIDATLKRLDTGDFGYCMTCDEEIDLRRLELDPTVTLCIDCARG